MATQKNYIRNILLNYFELNRFCLRHRAFLFVNHLTRMSSQSCNKPKQKNTMKEDSIESTNPSIAVPKELVGNKDAENLSTLVKKG